MDARRSHLGVRSENAKSDRRYWGALWYSNWGDRGRAGYAVIVLRRFGRICKRDGIRVLLNGKLSPFARVLDRDSGLN